MSPVPPSWYEQVESQLGILKDDLEENTAATKRNSDAIAQLVDNTAAVVSAFDAASGAFRVLEMFGKLAKPIIWIMTAVGTVTATWNWSSIKTWFGTFLK